MADAATTADRTVAAYCGPGGVVKVSYPPGAPMEMLYDSAVDKLQATLAERKGRKVQTSDVVLWRVSREDAKKLRHGVDLSDAPSKVELDPEDVIADDTFTADHRIWAQLLGAWGAALRRWAAAAGCTPWGGVLSTPVRPLICTTLPTQHRASHRLS
jgi:hypothetical protein